MESPLAFCIDHHDKKQDLRPYSVLFIEIYNLNYSVCIIISLKLFDAHWSGNNADLIEIYLTLEYR
jgi:hypothetical protein